ncbi:MULTISPECIES: metal-dependent hydrolase family protein [Clostridium]|uniref:metal-dependent hydrolase family protein n=1 Tax=Clostridium TaxID=1485 RepID=UPI00069E8697|nr:MULTISPECIES: amidohydrolase family protein [Clostridium]KOF58192.1 amidohydrolase [Clostridium sp. DMHC 10]MCD2345559.1 amidohydrolase family protein [Clostridium guangxiense]
MSTKTFFKGATLISGTGSAAIKNSGLLIENNKIKKVSSADDFHLESNTTIVDLSGKTIMPGMINCHVHITMEPVGDPFAQKQSDATIAFHAAANAKKYLKAGVTYVKDMGAPNFINIDIRDAVNSGLIEGTRILACGKCLTMTGGHGWQMGRECDGVDEVRKAAREQLRAGADFLKIMATGGVMTPGVEPGSPQLNQDEIEAAVIEAHKVGKKTSTHAQGATGIKNAVLAGIDSVEHGIYLTDEIIDLMLKKGTYLVPTLNAPYFIVENGIEAGIPAYMVEKSKRVIEDHTRSFQRAKAAGVKIAMGTDGSTPFNGPEKTAFELNLMVKAGLTPMEAIVASTKSAAELLGVDADFGTLGTGKTADFIVLNENPLLNIDTLMNVAEVYKDGKKIIF